MNEMTDYRSFLKTCFSERRRTNPQYSLRAFARDLRLAPGRLSKILNYKQGLSESMARELARRLGMSPAETEVFGQLVNVSDARSKVARAEAKTKLAEKFKETFTLFEDDEFKFIRDWYYFGLIDLAQIPGFKSDPQWIAKRLGISVLEVEAAIERPIRLGVFEKKGTRLVCKKVNITTTRDIPSSNIREFHRQIIQKAMRALNEQAVHERDFSALTLPVDTRLIPQLKDKIEKLRREMLRAQEKLAGGSPLQIDEVYCISIQFFRLTEKD